MTLRGLFLNAKEVRELAGGEVIFSEGDPGSHMFGVISGEVELRRGGAGPWLRITEGGTFGELAVIDGQPRSLTAVAAVPSQVAVIDEKTFLFLVHETPMFALQVMRSLSQRIRRLTEDT